MVYISVLAHRDDEGCFKINPCGVTTTYKGEGEQIIFVSQAD